MRIVSPFSLALLVGLASAQSSPTTYSIALKGDMGETLPNEFETVDLSWTNTLNKNTVVQKAIPLKLADSVLTWSVPFNQTMANFTIKFTNDKYWAVNGVQYDRNVRVNMDSFTINGAPVASNMLDIGGPIMNAVSATDDQTFARIKGGYFKNGGDYVFSVLPVAPVGPRFTDAACADASQQLVCFKLRGEQGDLNAKDRELIRLTYTTTDGQSVIVGRGLGMFSNDTTFGFKIPAGKSIQSFTVKYLNDVWYTNGQGVQVDGIVWLNVNSVSVAGVALNADQVDINGPVLDAFAAQNNDDVWRTIKGGRLPTNGDYVVNLLPQRTFSPLATDAACADASNGLLCFKARGTMNATYPNYKEMLRVNATFSDGTFQVLYRGLRLENSDGLFGFKLPTGKQLQSFSVRFLNDRYTQIADGLWIDANVLFNMDSVVLNGQSLTRQQLDVTGSTLDTMITNNNDYSFRQVKVGQWMWGGEYVVNVLSSPQITPFPSMGACLDPTNRLLCFMARGTMDDSYPAYRELLRLTLNSTDGSSLLVRGIQLESSNTLVGVRVPDGKTLQSLTLRFVNDRYFKDANGNVFDANVLLSLDSFILNGQPFFYDQVDINGPLVDTYANANNDAAWRNVRSGNFGVGGDYIVNLNSQRSYSPYPTPDICADASNNMLCFKAKGSMDPSYPDYKEMIRVNATYTDGTFQVLGRGVRVENMDTLVGFRLPTNKQLQSFTLRFLNDRSFKQDDGTQVDANIYFNKESVTIAGVAFNGDQIDIGGYYIDYFGSRDADSQFRQVRNGEFLWGGDYTITPLSYRTYSPYPTADACADPNNRLLCFRARGTMNLTVYPTYKEMFRLSLNATDGTSTVVGRGLYVENDETLFGFRIPQGKTVSTFTLRFLNDRYFQNAAGEWIDANIFVNIESITINGTPFVGDQVVITGPVYDKFVASNDDPRITRIQGGYFYWQGDYYISLLPTRPWRPVINEQTCADPAKRLVCFRANGDIGETMLNDQEKMRLTWTTTDGARVIAGREIKLTKTQSLYGVYVPEGKTIANFTINFTNDAYYLNSEGNRVDRNIRLNTTSVTHFGTSLVDAGPYIRGTFYDKQKAANATSILNAIAKGTFAWNTDYVIPLPLPANPCQASFPGELAIYAQDKTSNAKNLCLPLRSSLYDSAKLIIKATDGSETETATFALTPDFANIQVIHPKVIDSVRVKVVSNRIAPALELSLGGILANRGLLADNVPCTDTISTASEVKIQVN